MANIIFPSSLNHRHAFTPPWYEKVKPKPVFWFRAGSISDRAQYLTDLDVEGGEEVHQFMKDMAFRAGIEDLLPDTPEFPHRPDERAKLFSLLDARVAGDEISPDDRLLFNNAWDFAVQNWADLKILTRRESMRNQLLPPFALLHFCIGMENVKDERGELIEFETDDRGKMKESVIMRLWQPDLTQAGIFAHHLQNGWSMEKNLSRRLPSAAKVKRSRAATKAPG